MPLGIIHTKKDSVLCLDDDLTDRAPTRIEHRIYQIMTIHLYLIQNQQLILGTPSQPIGFSRRLPGDQIIGPGEIKRLVFAIKIGNNKPAWSTGFRNGFARGLVPDPEYAGFGKCLIRNPPVPAGVERQHWGLGGIKGENAYWDGPWCGMGLLDWYDDHKKPSYHTFRLMVELLDGFTACEDLSLGDVRVFRFTVSGESVFVLWNANAAETPIDLTSILGEGELLVIPIVTQLDASLAPIERPRTVHSISEVPLSSTPVFAKRP